MIFQYILIKYYIYINNKNKLPNFNINISIYFEMSNYTIVKVTHFFLGFTRIHNLEYFTSQSNSTLSSFSRLEYSLLN